MKHLKLFNTLTRSVEPFSPRVPGKVGIYCCGPTVYNYQHIGNLKTYVFEDVLVRTLRYAGYDVTHVMNITDVGHLVSDADAGEDKMLLAAKREGKRSHEIADYYTQVFFDDCAALQIKRPDVVCKATDHIPEMIALIERIERNGYAYTAGGNVYFDVERFSNYGALARLDLSALKAGARVEVDSNKRSPLDFALWFTKSKFEGQELVWESPWGTGYPGWHIECSAMSLKYLGEEFDIHCGGIDHIPVHHTNEIAQTEAATGKSPWVSVWMHSDFVLFNKEKMSKSKGTFLTLSDLASQGILPETYRYFCLTGSYRSQLNFGDQALEGAQAAVSKLKNIVISLRERGATIHAELDGTGAREHLTSFDTAVLNDLNTPQALAVLWAVAGDSTLTDSEKLSLLERFDQILGLGVSKWIPTSLDLSPEIAALVSARDAARAAKDWKESDRLREELLANGYLVEDRQGKTVVKRGGAY